MRLRTRAPRPPLRPTDLHRACRAERGGCAAAPAVLFAPEEARPFRAVRGAARASQHRQTHWRTASTRT
eukprot:6071337-Alexandrium_andersonii.AAC.1